MGTVYKESYTKPLPVGAKIIVRKGQRLAEWIDAKGKRRTAPLTTAGYRIAVEAGTYIAKYRDGTGIVRKVSTGCRDESAARSILAKLERRAELVKGEVLTAAEDAVIDHQATSLADHIAAYLDHQRRGCDHQADYGSGGPVAPGRERLQLRPTGRPLGNGPRKVAGDAGFGRHGAADAEHVPRGMGRICELVHSGGPVAG